jgi:hypothetical protein
MRARRSIDSARTGGLRSSDSEETCSSRWAAACMDISLTDFESNGVLQIYDIRVLKSELERIERIMRSEH